MKPWRPSVVSGVQRRLRQRLHDPGGQVQRVDELVLGGAGMDRHALDAHRRLVGGEALVHDLALLPAVEGVGDLGAQVARKVGVHAPADLLVGGEGDADRAVGDAGIGQQVARGGHHDGDARLVVGAEQRGAAGGDDVVAELPAGRAPPPARARAPAHRRSGWRRRRSGGARPASRPWPDRPARCPHGRGGRRSAPRGRRSRECWRARRRSRSAARPRRRWPSARRRAAARGRAAWPVLGEASDASSLWVSIRA